MDGAASAATDVSRLNLFHHREVAAWQGEPPNLPVTLVTGFLGAGKTALVGHLLRSAQNLRIAAAVNDAAEVNIDAALVQQEAAAGVEVYALGNGCLCCSSAAEDGFTGECPRTRITLLTSSRQTPVDRKVAMTPGKWNL